MKWPMSCRHRGSARGPSGALRVTYGRAVTRPIRYLPGAHVVGLSKGEIVVRMAFS
jgi:hypothetical protein